MKRALHKFSSPDFLNFTFIFEITFGTSREMSDSSDSEEESFRCLFKMSKQLLKSRKKRSLRTPKTKHKM